jgi:hypothetical protein
MANEKDGFSDAHEIIYVVEKPWKYKNEWMEFNKEVLEEESDCPYDEPLHNHHDGCPSCYTAHPEVERHDNRTGNIYNVVIDARIYALDDYSSG